MMTFLSRWRHQNTNNDKKTVVSDVIIISQKAEKVVVMEGDQQV
jgi:hypothetical protein